MVIQNEDAAFLYEDTELALGQVFVVFFLSYWGWFCINQSVLSNSSFLMFSAKKLAREQDKWNGPPRGWAHNPGFISTLPQTADSNQSSTEVAEMVSRALN